jgi:alginate O-acetyltransferase complex protein AlgI
MTFTSLPFLLFLPSVFILFSITPSQLRWLLLLVASYFFYAYLKVPYLLFVLAAVTAVSYWCGHKINRAETPYLKKVWLWAGIAVNVSFLVWLKYIPFLTENLNFLLGWVSPGFKINNVHHLIAIGVSFFVFQGISYIIDIYLEILEPENHLGYFALSISFFPKLLQGPIERGGGILPQMRRLSPGSWENLRAGANLFVWGMFKKVVVADRLATFVDPVYSNVHAFHGISLIVATYLFALQIYFDFSGYTDMALGIARFFNIRLTQNFNAPYWATSIADFWRRWHISFSSWILDYIFKPIQFSLRDWLRWGTPLALMATFIASGLWHGASWCFVVWGGLHGVYLSFATIFRPQKRKLSKMLGMEKSTILKAWQRFATFHLVCFSWIFFRADNIMDALYVVRSSIVDIPHSASRLINNEGALAQHILMGKATDDFLSIMALLVLTFGVEVVDRRTARSISQVGEFSFLAKAPVWMKGCVYGIICYLMAFIGTSTQSFIYLQF